MAFRRVMQETQLAEAIYFVDFPILNGNDCARRMAPGPLYAVRSAEWHSLTNDTITPVAILVAPASMA